MSSVATRRRMRRVANLMERARHQPEVAVLRAIRSVAAETAKHSVLWRMHQRGVITYPQWQAGMRFQQDELASRDVHTSDMSPDLVRGGGIPTERLQRQAMALKAYREAWNELCRAGARVATDTAEVCVRDQEPRAIARPRLPRALLSITANPDEVAVERNKLEREIVDRLKLGLDELRRHYGD